MKESSFYQLILDEGAAIGEARGEARGEATGKSVEARNILLRLGLKRFGSPDRSTVEAIEAIQEVERIEVMIDRVLEMASWAEVLGSGPEGERAS